MWLDILFPGTMGITMQLETLIEALCSLKVTCSIWHDINYMKYSCQVHGTTSGVLRVGISSPCHTSSPPPPPSPRSRLVMSETMSEQNPRSPYRRMVGHHGPTAPSGLSVVSHGGLNTEDLLEAAKSNIHRLKEKEEKSDRKV